MASAGLRELAKKLYYCEHCGLCRSVCPILRQSSQEESVGPRGRKTLFLGLAEGQLRPSPALAEKFYLCTTCRACYFKCPAGIDIGEFSILARHELLKARAVSPFIRRVTSSVTDGVSRGDIFGASRTKAKWSRGLDIPVNGETLFFASCMDSSMAYGEALLRLLQIPLRIGERLVSASRTLQSIGLYHLFESVAQGSLGFYRNTLADTVKSLQILGVDVAYMRENEPCCGVALHTYGLVDEFSEHARKVQKIFAEKGVKRLITHNPICGAAFKTLYPQFVKDWNIEVKHVTEVIAEKMPQQDLRLPSKKATVTYHDPCFLARYMNVVEEPRTILRRIENIQLVEPPHNRLDTNCDGGGGVELLYPDVCQDIAESRVKELVSTGAQKIVSCCPVCALMLKEGIKKTGAKAQYVDIMTLFYEAAKGLRK